MRVLLDECVDWRLMRDLTGHDVKSARQMGWSEIKNGQLLKLAASAFDVFVTVDKNLSYQNKVLALPLAVLVLHGASSKLQDLRALMPQILLAIDETVKGNIVDITAIAE
jgi:predicted nuclease of predicted toxin-antitoxin system